MGMGSAVALADEDGAAAAAGRARGEGVATRKGAGWRLAGWAGVALLLALVVIQYMIRRGRLSTAPDWDDVMYMQYAADRVNDLHDGGLWACLSGFVKNTPHSPVSCALAFASFVVFGLREWAPYVASALVVWSVFAMADWVMGRAAVRLKVLGVLYLCTVPAVTLAVCQYKPDMAWGVCVAAAAFVSVLRPVVGAPWWRLVALGLLWAGALLTKSTTAPATVALAGLSLVLATAKDWVEGGRWPGAWRVARAWVWVVAVAVVVAGPYFVLNWGYLAYYINQAMFGEYRHVWQVAGGWRVQFGFFLTGEGGRENLAGHLWLMPVVWAVGVGLAGWRRDGVTLLRAAAVGVFMLACYVVPSVNPLKNPLIASPLYCVAMLATAYGVGYVGRCEAGRYGTVWRTGWGLAVMIVVGVGLYQWPGTYYPPGSPEPAQGRRLHDEVYRELAGRKLPYEQSVAVMGTGPVRQITLAWMASVDHARFKFERPYSSRVSDYEPYADRSDYVLAQEDGVLGCAAYMPNEQGDVQGRVLEMMRHRADFRELKEFTAADGKKLVLFQRTRWASGVMSGVRAVEGFGPEQGPYPKAKPPLPRFYWGMGRESRLVLTPEWNGQAATLRVECRTTDRAQAVRVVRGGVVLGTHRFERPWVSETFEVAVPRAEAGQELTLEYEGRGATRAWSSSENSAMYTKVELVPAAGG